MSRARWALSCWLLALAAGCSREGPVDSQEGATGNRGAPSASTAPPPASAVASASAGGEPPTEEDFEDDAESEINSGNLDSELDKLEAEIGQ